MAFTTRKDLLQKVHSNDQQAWNDFVEYYTPLIQLCAKDFSLTQQESEELRQIVCLTVFKKDLTLTKAAPSRRRCGPWRS